MQPIVLTDELTTQLTAAGEMVTLCDPQGNVIGYFQPALKQPHGCQEISSEMMGWACEQISDEELEQRSKQKGGITTEELLERLKKL